MKRPHMEVDARISDTARGLSIASLWTEFVRNSGEWFENNLAYYAWKKGNV